MGLRFTIAPNASFRHHLRRSTSLSMTQALRQLGARILGALRSLGLMWLLAWESAVAILQGRPRWQLFFQQVLEIGARSQLVVIVTGAFTGAVFAAQTFFQFDRLGMESAVGVIVSLSMCRELGPVLGGIMVAGRVGAAMSAEIGTMKVTEQIDALRALGVHPVDYLVVPRVLAMVVSMPLLVAEAIALGILAGYVMAVHVFGVVGTYFLANMEKFTAAEDVLKGLMKACIFGLIIVFVSCQKGLATTDGAVGVGRSTTDAVVVSTLSILVCNLFLTMGLNIIFPT